MCAMTTIRLARPADIAPLHQLVESAYRGDSARAGWTHEADLLDGTRTDSETLAAILDAPAERLLVAERDGDLIGCVQLTDRSDGVAYLGLLAVSPAVQAGGLGRQLIAAAEELARTDFGAGRIEMTVISQRAELIAYYERRGYAATGERRPFPIRTDPPLEFVVLEKRLG
jgi:predicted N-acetyltransferase YhbS